jgi:hypothetical protein
LVTTSETATGRVSSIILSSSPAADTQPEGLNPACSPMACTHLHENVKYSIATHRGCFCPVSPRAMGTELGG